MVEWTSLNSRARRPMRMKTSLLDLKTKRLLCNTWSSSQAKKAYLLSRKLRTITSLFSRCCSTQPVLSSSLSSLVSSQGNQRYDKKKWRLFNALFAFARSYCVKNKGNTDLKMNFFANQEIIVKKTWSSSSETLIGPWSSDKGTFCFRTFMPRTSTSAENSVQLSWELEFYGRFIFYLAYHSYNPCHRFSP